jgi:hypothetical protein
MHNTAVTTLSTGRYVEDLESNRRASSQNMGWHAPYQSELSVRFNL